MAGDDGDRVATKQQVDFSSALREIGEALDEVRALHHEVRRDLRSNLKRVRLIEQRLAQLKRLMPAAREGDDHG